MYWVSAVGQLQALLGPVRWTSTYSPPPSSHGRSGSKDGCGQPQAQHLFSSLIVYFENWSSFVSKWKDFKLPINLFYISHYLWVHLSHLEDEGSIWVVCVCFHTFRHMASYYPGSPSILTLTFCRWGNWIREVMKLAQDCTAGRCLSWDLSWVWDSYAHVLFLTLVTVIGLFNFDNGG